MKRYLCIRRWLHALGLSHCALCGLASPNVLCFRCSLERSIELQYGCTCCAAATVGPNCVCHLWNQTYPFDSTILGWNYSGSVAQCIRQAKYKGDVLLFEELCQRFASMRREQIRSVIRDKSCLVPYPSLSRTLRERTFDHTMIMAKTIRRFACAGALIDPHLLRFPRHRTERSSQLGTRERIRQAQQIEINEQKTVPANVILVDDVQTSGASTSSAAQLLRQSGAKRVDLVVLARAESFYSHQARLAEALSKSCRRYSRTGRSTVLGSLKGDQHDYTLPTTRTQL